MREDLFRYAFIIALSIAISFHFSMSLATVFFAVVAFFATKYMHETKQKGLVDDFEQWDYRLSVLQGLACGLCSSYDANNEGQEYELTEFARDTEIIDIFYDTKEFAKFNKDAFVQAMRNCNSLLRIYGNITEKGMKWSCMQQAQIAFDKYKNVMNHWHSLVLTTPSVYDQLLSKKHKQASDFLQLRLLQYIQEMRDACPKEIYPYDKYFVSGLEQPQEEYSNTTLQPTSAFDRY